MADYVEYDSAGTSGEEYNERVEKNSDESEDRPKVLVKKRKGKEEERGKREEKWKLSEIEKFLELYELYRCLWDYKVDEYQDRNAKEHAWDEIVRGMEKREFTVKKAKDKIRVLRNTYSNELTKIYKSKVSGAGLDDVYVPTLMDLNNGSNHWRCCPISREPINRTFSGMYANTSLVLLKEINFHTNLFKTIKKNLQIFGEKR
ncbi:hypothetical protein J6590_050218 [Homalodisca vitripennis]|nr:hypothetical protein J6590_050218 [Homalodisca vitripennis]